MTDIRALHLDNRQTLIMRVGERTKSELDMLSKADREATLRRLLVQPGCSTAYRAATHWQQLTTTTIPNLAIMEGRRSDYTLSPGELLKRGHQHILQGEQICCAAKPLDNLLSNSIPNCGLTISVAHSRRCLRAVFRRHRVKIAGQSGPGQPL